MATSCCSCAPIFRVVMPSACAPDIDPGRGCQDIISIGRTASSRSEVRDADAGDRCVRRGCASGGGARDRDPCSSAGSSIRRRGRRNWRQLLAEAAERIPSLEWMDLGGGLGVPERPGQEPLDLEAMEPLLSKLRSRLPGCRLRLEPGRYLVSEAGVLVAPVTQVRRKNGTNLVGIATGTNSLIRPALYGAWHGIHNLTRLDEGPVDYWNIVGPICESSDVLGRDRWLPPMKVGDVVLIENAGAYGAVMSSRYNQRPPAAEIVLD
ncbi:MAG: hypothetical protein R3E12_02630 [Candidatus Eisenbacteria bacterium]